MIWGYNRGGQAKAGVSHPAEPPLGWRQIPGRIYSERTKKSAGHLDTWPGISFRDKKAQECGPNWDEPTKVGL